MQLSFQNRSTRGSPQGMTGVALLDRSFDEASAPESCGESRLPATSVVAQKTAVMNYSG
jgi:hypothetical protein